MKKIILWFIPFMFSVNLYAQNSANEPTLQETLDWLSSKCTIRLAYPLDYYDHGIKPGVRIYSVTLHYNLDQKEILYYFSNRIYSKEGDHIIFLQDDYLKIHFEDLSGCQITPKKNYYGTGGPNIEITLVSHNKCKRKFFHFPDNTNDYATFDFDRLNYEPDTDCSGIIINLFYRDVSSDRIIKALQHLIMLTGGTLEPF
jgi:hypothetical protein